MAWIVVLSIALVAVGVMIAIVLITRRRQPDTTSAAAEPSADQWFALGIIFTGAGVALTVALGPFMIWMMALGIIYMGMGARMKRDRPQ
jgi:NADH:ubiquinone oxidoreductase subunit 2 (subunit N)